MRKTDLFCCSISNKVTCRMSCRSPLLLLFREMEIEVILPMDSFIGSTRVIVLFAWSSKFGCLLLYCQIYKHRHGEEQLTHQTRVNTSVDRSHEKSLEADRSFELFHCQYPMSQNGGVLKSRTCPTNIGFMCTYDNRAVGQHLGLRDKMFLVQLVKREDPCD